MNRFFYAFLLAFTFSAIPTMAQEDSAREIEEVVITALRKRPIGFFSYSSYLLYVLSCVISCVILEKK